MGIVIILETIVVCIIIVYVLFYAYPAFPVAPQVIEQDPRAVVGQDHRPGYHFPAVGPVAVKGDHRGPFPEGFVPAREGDPVRTDQADLLETGRRAPDSAGGRVGNQQDKGSLDREQRHQGSTHQPHAQQADPVPGSLPGFFLGWLCCCHL